MITTIDFSILNWIQTTIASPFLDLTMPFISSLGNIGSIWILLAVVLFIAPKTRRLSIALGIAVILGVICGNLILKNIFDRLRPFQQVPFALLIPPPHESSFPSGHSLSSFAAATAVVIGSRKIGIPALILAFLIAFSRLYLYVHFPTDVLVGSLLGIFLGIVGYQLSQPVYKQINIILKS